MPTYRLFPIAKNGLIADAPIVVEAIHDSAALIQSKRVLNDCTHEVWQGARFVGVVSGRPAHDHLTDLRAAFAAAHPLFQASLGADALEIGHSHRVGGGATSISAG